MPFTIINDFDLNSTVNSGQIFRFKQNSEKFEIFHREKRFRISQDKNKLLFQGASRSFIREFFQLNAPLKSLLKSINKDKTISKSIKRFPGLRIIKQDPWECTISFLCSSAAPISKIKTNTFLLSKLFGTNHGFPKQGSLSNLQKIKKAKTGYRAKYIKETNKFIAKNPDFLENLKTLPYQEAKDSLTNLPGIGNKIADCILLFSLDFSEAFPIDVWIQRTMQKYYPNSGKSYKQINEFAQSYFGNNAGYAQQYLYHSARSKII